MSSISASVGQGPARPNDLAARAAKALAAHHKTDTPNEATSSAERRRSGGLQDYKAEKIARGADPAMVFGIQVNSGPDAKGASAEARAEKNYHLRRATAGYETARDVFADSAKSDQQAFDRKKTTERAQALMKG